MSDDLVGRALWVAYDAHRGQYRKHSTDPYIVHPLRLRNTAASLGLPPSVQAAALLHDVVEDTNVTQYMLASKLEGAGTPDELFFTLHLVNLLTKWWNDDAPAEKVAAHKEGYYASIAHEPAAIMVKMLDRVDNLNEMNRILPGQLEWISGYLAKTEVEFAPLYEKCNDSRIKEMYTRAYFSVDANVRGFKHARMIGAVGVVDVAGGV